MRWGILWVLVVAGCATTPPRQSRLAPRVEIHCVAAGNEFLMEYYPTPSVRMPMEHPVGVKTQGKWVQCIGGQLWRQL